MAMGGLGLSLAGFAGLLAAFHDEDDGEPEIYKWRISMIVMGSLFVLFLGFGIVPIHTWVEDTESAIRIVTGLAVVLATFSILRFNKPGPAWPDERLRKIVKASVTVQVAVVSLNLIFASLAYLQFIFLWLLFSPVSVFYNAVRDEAASASKSSADDL